MTLTPETRKDTARRLSETYLAKFSPRMRGSQTPREFAQEIAYFALLHFGDLMPPRVKSPLSPVGNNCEGCGETITEDEHATLDLHGVSFHNVCGEDWIPGADQWLK